MIALPSTTVTIDGETYTIRALDGIVCAELYAKLFNAVGAALQGASSLKVDPKNPTASAPALIGAVMANLSPELARELRETFANSCTVRKEGGKEPELKSIFGVHFARRMAHMSKWLLECARWNFADFLDENLLGEMFAKFQGPEPSASSSQTD